MILTFDTTALIFSNLSVIACIVAAAITFSWSGFDAHLAFLADVTSKFA
jgi:hypothetical protein